MLAEEMNGRRPHYKELLQLLNEFEVEYLIVGGLAVMKYGEPRHTKNLGVWIRNSPQNSRRLEISWPTSGPWAEAATWKT